MRLTNKQQVIMLANGIIQNANTLKKVFQDEQATVAECKAALTACTTLTDEYNQALKVILKNIKTA